MEQGKAPDQLHGTAAKSSNGSRWQAEIGRRVWRMGLRGVGRGVVLTMLLKSLGNSGWQKGLRMAVPRG